MSVKRRRNPEVVDYVYRDNAVGEEQEIEVEVEGQWEGSDPSCGFVGGFFFEAAKRTDDGTVIELTRAEIERIVERAEEQAQDRAEAAYLDAAEARADALADR